MWSFFKFIAVLVGLISMSATSMAQTENYPEDTVRLIVPRAPGGGSDTIARLLAPELEKRLGATFLVENRPDSTTARGAAMVAAAAPDGYTLFVSDNSFYQNPALLKDLPYDIFEDFTAVTMLAEGPVILLARPDLPVNNLKELVELAKAEPGALTYASGGVGSSTHFAGVLLGVETGISMVHVPFKASSEALNALLGGQVDLQFGGLSSAKPMIETGRVKAIALSGRERMPAMPEIPTNIEEGFSDVDVMSVWGIHAPAGTPIEIREKLQKTIYEIVNTPHIQEKLVGLGYIALANSPQDHQKQTEDMANLWIEIAKEVDLYQ